MLKAQELANPNGCLNRSQDDEPVFVLVARDRLAPELVDAWADRAEAHGVTPAKVAEARELAVQMRVWQTQRGSKIPD